MVNLNAIRVLLLATLVLGVAPGAAQAAECPAMRDVVHLTGQAAVFVTTPGHYKVCDLVSGRVRKVAGGGKLRLASFASAGRWLATTYGLGAGERAVLTETDGKRELVKRGRPVSVHATGTMVYTSRSFLYSIRPNGRRTTVGDPGNFFDFGLAESRPASGPAVLYFNDRESFVSYTTFAQGRAATDPPRLPVATADGACARTEHRLVFADGQVRILEQPATRTFLLCDARTNTVHPMGGGGDGLSIARPQAAGGWLSVSETTAAGITEHVVYNVASGARRVVSTATIAGLTVDTEGVAAFGQTGEDPQILLNDAEGKTTRLDKPRERAKLRPDTVAFDGDYVYYLVGDEPVQYELPFE